MMKVALSKPTQRFTDFWGKTHIYLSVEGHSAFEVCTLEYLRDKLAVEDIVVPGDPGDPTQLYLILGIVVGVVLLIIISVTVYCCCCSGRSDDEDPLGVKEPLPQESDRGNAETPKKDQETGKLPFGKDVEKSYDAKTDTGTPQTIKVHGSALEE